MDKANFKEPIESLYTDKNICVTGTLKEYNNKPEIIISKPEDIIIQ
jgi:DNA/RNA endonuclease YhcR with UshA esterase domain